jgi:hypothetical protein
VRLYATAGDVWEPGAEPANAAVLLRAASRAVDHLLVGTVYATDAAGMPTDADVAQALTDAAVAIVRELEATGATEPGGTAEWDTAKIGNVSLSGRKVTEGARTVAGIPVPAIALVHLSGVGYTRVAVRA